MKMPLPRSLLTVEYPQGFGEDGRRLLAKCPEFQLYELYEEGGPTELVTRPAIERALWRAIFRIKGPHTGPWSEETNRRIDWAIAFKKMMRYQERGFTGSDVPLAQALAKAMAPEISKVLSSKEARGEADKVATMFRDAILALAREAGAIRDYRAKLKISTEALLIWEAQGTFMHTRKRPRKSYLRERLMALGLRPPKKKEAADWREWFARAGLDKLPE